MVKAIVWKRLWWDICPSCKNKNRACCHSTYRPAQIEGILNGCEVFLLDGVLKEEVYVKQPPSYGFFGEQHKVYRLKRDLYELKQAPQV